jgi:hypothetical protein
MTGADVGWAIYKQIVWMEWNDEAPFTSISLLRLGRKPTGTSMGDNVNRDKILLEMELGELQRLLLKTYLEPSPKGDEDIQIVDDELQAISGRQQQLSNEYWMNVQNWDERTVMAAMADMRSAIRRVKWRL